MKKTELLIPAGNLEKLKVGVIYGADSVYLGGKEFSLRARAANFTLDEINEGIAFAHKRGVKVYITVNIIPHNRHLSGIRDYIKKLKHLEPDGLIISDPSVIEIAKEAAPDIPLHLSTQASTANWQTVKFWEKQEMSRVVLARELSLKDIREIRDRVNLEIECFIHGAMCISYSGRCLLSAYLTSRDANLGECTHPCRWRYYLMEEKRPGKYYQIFEDEHGTHILNSKDLCMINHIPELIQAGIDCFKVEGRMKSVHYVAVVTRVYRQALEEYYADPDKYSVKKEWLEELKKISHRPYTTGFYLGKPGRDDQIYQDSANIREFDFIGIVREYNNNTGMALVEQRNYFARGEEVEFLTPEEEPFPGFISEIYTTEGEKMETAPHPQQLLLIPVKKEVKPYTIIRRRVTSE